MKTKKDILKKAPDMEKDSKILLLTHSDMDGAGAGILTKLAFKNVDIIHCSNGIMSKKIVDMVTNDETFDKYDYVLACDISCSREDAAIINESKNKDKLFVLDHHPTSTYLNKYNWAFVEPGMIEDSFLTKFYKTEYNVDISKGHSSGTSLMYDFLEAKDLLNEKYCSPMSTLQAMTLLISGYDTWDWNNLLDKNSDFEKIDKLCNIYGIEIFEKEMINRIKLDQSVFIAQDDLLLEIENNKIQNYLNDLDKSFKVGVMELNNKYYNVCYSYANKYLQDVFEKMKEIYPTIDLHIINYGTGISIRSTKDDISVGDITAAFGGGGHKGAGGFRIDFEKQKEYLEKVFESPIYLFDKDEALSLRADYEEENEIELD